MKTLKFIHCADIHLDSPIRDRGTGTYSNTRRNDIREAFKRILDRAKEEEAELLLISGDLYEHIAVNRSTMEWLYMVLSDVKIPVIIIPGNHDPYIVNSWYRSGQWPSNVTILTPEKPQLIIEDLNVNIYGIGFSSFKEDTPDLSLVSPPINGMFNIFMFHGTLDMSFTNQAYRPVLSEDLEALGYDYYALGHFHSRFEAYRLKNAYNPGSPEPLGFMEPGAHGAFFVRAGQGNKEIAVNSFDTANRTYHDIELDISGSKTIDEVKMKILVALEPYDASRDIVRINLKGRTSLSLEVDVLNSLISGDWLLLKIVDDTRKDFNLDELLKDTSLIGAYTREMKSRLDKVTQELEKNPADEDLLKEEKTLSLALDYGLEALTTGKIQWQEET